MWCGWAKPPPCAFQPRCSSLTHPPHGCKARLLPGPPASLHPARSRNPNHNTPDAPCRKSKLVPFRLKVFQLFWPRLGDSIYSSLPPSPHFPEPLFARPLLNPSPDPLIYSSPSSRTLPTSSPPTPRQHPQAQVPLPFPFSLHPLS